MADLDSRTSTLETRVDTLMENLALQFHTMNERLNDLRAWLIALTALAGVQLVATITMAMAIIFAR